mgnify:CR=1 FL=1
MNEQDQTRADEPVPVPSPAATPRDRLEAVLYELRRVVVGQDQLLDRILVALLARGREFEPFDRSLDVQISRLRKMIEPDPAQPRYIQTVWGVGYVFVPDGAS